MILYWCCSVNFGNGKTVFGLNFEALIVNPRHLLHFMTYQPTVDQT